DRRGRGRAPPSTCPPGQVSPGSRGGRSRRRREALPDQARAVPLGAEEGPPLTVAGEADAEAPRRRATEELGRLAAGHRRQVVDDGLAAIAAARAIVADQARPVLAAGGLHRQRRAPA